MFSHFCAVVMFIVANDKKKLRTSFLEKAEISAVFFSSQKVNF
jgi:hypothetical protein